MSNESSIKEGQVIRNFRWIHRKVCSKTTKTIKALMQEAVTWAEDAGASLKIRWSAASWRDVQTRLVARRHRIDFAVKANHRLTKVAVAAGNRLRQIDKRERRYAWARVKQRRVQDQVEEVLKTGEATRNFFQRAEKRRAAKPTNIATLSDAKGVQHTAELAKQRAACAYYADLWKKRPTDSEAQKLLLDTVSRKLGETDAKHLDEEITSAEVQRAIKLSKRGTAPGIDGIPIDFYKGFAKELGPLLAGMYNEMILQKKMPEDMATAIVVLLYKKNDRTALKNYRPISLLSAEYKILAKILAERLKKCLPVLVHQNQQGFVQGGDIRGNILLQKLTAAFCSEKLTPEDAAREGLDVPENDSQESDEDAAISRGGIAVFYDGEKAYDRQDRDFMCQVLERMGCRKEGMFMNAIRTIYSGTMATIRMNGNLSDAFYCHGGVRQGCPLSCYLYILVVETLAEMVRQTPRINGLHLPRLHSGKEVKIALFADDTTGYAQDWDSVYALRDCMSIFERASGARVNVDKTFVIVMGERWSPEVVDAHMAELKYKLLESDATEKYLGELITETGADSGDYKSVLAKARGTLLAWSRLRLRIHSRVKIANALIMPKFLYRASVAGMDKATILAMQGMLKRFVWGLPLGARGDGKHAKVALLKARRRWEQGGIELRDVGLMTRASRCSSIKMLRTRSRGKPVPTWGEWLYDDFANRLRDKGLTVNSFWESNPKHRRPKIKWSNANYTDSCARVWWQLRARTDDGEAWAQKQQNRLGEKLQGADTDKQRKLINAKLNKLTTAFVELRQGDAFFCAHPQKIVSIADMSAKMIYWTLVEIEDKVKRSTDDVRDETSNLVREKRLKRITMTDDEKDLWFLFRNGQLRLGYSIAWKWQGRRGERNSNRCCMCKADSDRWSHVLICPVRLSWVKE